MDCFGLRGSRDGALGIVQFMPDTLEKYSVDGNGDGFINPCDPLDAIPSAAKFLDNLGWNTNPTDALTRYYGEPGRYPAAVLKYALALGWQHAPLPPPTIIAKAKSAPATKAASAKAKPKTVLPSKTASAKPAPKNP